MRHLDPLHLFGMGSSASSTALASKRHAVPPPEPKKSTAPEADVRAGTAARPTADLHDAIGSSKEAEDALQPGHVSNHAAAPAWGASGAGSGSLLAKRKKSQWLGTHAALLTFTTAAEPSGASGLQLIREASGSADAAEARDGIEEADSLRLPADSVGLMAVVGSGAAGKALDRARAVSVGEPRRVSGALSPSLQVCSQG